MRHRMQKALYNQRGAALPLALFLMVAFLMLSVSILSSSQVLHNTVLRQDQVTQCRELALSISEVLDRQLADVHVVPDLGSPNPQTDFENKMLTIQKTNPLWSYVRSRILQDGWAYWDEYGEASGHGSDMAWRDYDVRLPSDGSGEIDQNYKIKVTLYWLNDDSAMLSEPEVYAPNAGKSPKLGVIVSCRSGRRESAVTSVYTVNITAPEKELVEDLDGTVQSYTSASPYGTSIYWLEDWSFDLESRG
ncbi:MAG: hypothetical protein HUJ72_12800 [Blautia sp.]|nr:hypothetical protein [Blautia sp.]